MDQFHDETTEEDDEMYSASDEAERKRNRFRRAQLMSETNHGGRPQHSFRINQKKKKKKEQRKRRMEELKASQQSFEREQRAVLALLADGGGRTTDDDDDDSSHTPSMSSVSFRPPRLLPKGITDSFYSKKDLERGDGILWSSSGRQGQAFKLPFHQTRRGRWMVRIVVGLIAVGLMLTCTVLILEMIVKKHYSGRNNNNNALGGDATANIPPSAVFGDCDLTTLYSECATQRSASSIPECAIERYEEVRDELQVPGYTMDEDNYDSCEAPNLALWTLAATPNTSLSTTSLHNRLALLSLYFSTNGHQWGSSNSNDNNSTPSRLRFWVSEHDKSECDWRGVKCKHNTDVTDLELRDKNLVGTIPPELSHLTKLGELTIYSTILEPAQEYILTTLKLSICLSIYSTQQHRGSWIEFEQAQGFDSLIIGKY